MDAAWQVVAWNSYSGLSDIVNLTTEFFFSKKYKTKHPIYVNGDQPLIFAPNVQRGLDTFIDSSWGTRFSISGCLVFYHGLSMCVIAEIAMHKKSGMIRITLGYSIVS